LLIVNAAPHCFGRRFEYNIVVMASVGCGRWSGKWKVEVTTRTKHREEVEFPCGTRERSDK